MPTINIIQAVNDALRAEMKRDDRVVIMGEDVGKFGGVFRATQGLFQEFGSDRVFDTPLAEAGIIGSAIGMALYGMRPVPEIQFVDFIYPAFDQIVNEAAKMRYRSGGQFTCPMVIRAPSGGGIKGGHYHSQSPETYFIHTAGLKVVMPSNPYDAKGLLIASIRDDNPVIFLEPKSLYRAARGEVPEEEYVIELGKAKVVRAGEDITVVTYGAMVRVALEAAETAEEEDVALHAAEKGLVARFVPGKGRLEATLVVGGLAELGAFGIKIPTKYGGLGLSQTNYSRAATLLGATCGNLAALLSALRFLRVLLFKH